MAAATITAAHVPTTNQGRLALARARPSVENIDNAMGLVPPHLLVGCGFVCVILRISLWVGEAFFWRLLLFSIVEAGPPPHLPVKCVF
jgi:hypothetical protein